MLKLPFFPPINTVGFLGRCNPDSIFFGLTLLSLAAHATNNVSHFLAVVTPGFRNIPSPQETVSPFPWSGNGEDEGLGDEMAETRETELCG